MTSNSNKARSTTVSGEKNIHLVKGIFFTLLLVAVLGFFIFSAHDDQIPIEPDEPVYIDTWKMTDPNGNVSTQGRTYRSTVGLKGTYTIESRLPDKTSDNSYFCFIVGGNYSVYINGELRKDFDQERDFPLPGGIVKRFYTLIPLKDTDSGAEIKIVRAGATRRGFVYQETMVASHSALYFFFMAKYGISLLLGGVLFLFAFVISIISVVMRILYKRRMEMLYGAMSIAVISGWIITNSYLFPFISGHYHFDGLLNYILCMMLPFNLLFYLDGLSHGRYRKIVIAILWLSVASLLTWTILHFTKIFSLSSALPYMNFILAIQVLVVFAIFIAEIVRGYIHEYIYTAI